jgi:hypothetical protein
VKAFEYRVWYSDAYVRFACGPALRIWASFAVIVTTFPVTVTNDLLDTIPIGWYLMRTDYTV